MRNAAVRRILKRALLLGLKLTGTFRVIRKLYRGHVRILCYHGAWIGPAEFGGDQMFISPRTFESRLQLLQRLGYDVISLDDAVRGLSADGPLPPNPVVITIDDGWFSTFAIMLPALERRRMPATVYCDTANLLSERPVWHVMATYLLRIHGAEHSAELSSLFDIATDPTETRPAKQAAIARLAAVNGWDIAAYQSGRVFSYMTPAEAAEAKARGFSIQLHTHHHTLHNFNPDDVAAEVELNRSALSRVLCEDAGKFKHFCYPSGLTAPGVEAALLKAGILSATTLDPGLASPRDNMMRLPRILDGDERSALEFEAELSGIGEMLRSLRRFISSRFSALAKPFDGLRPSVLSRGAG